MSTIQSLAGLVEKHRAIYEEHGSAVLELLDHELYRLHCEHRAVLDRVAELTETTAAVSAEAAHQAGRLAAARTSLAEAVDVDALRRALDERTREATALRMSVSWRITAPLRGLYARLLRFKQGAEP